MSINNKDYEKLKKNNKFLMINETCMYLELEEGKLNCSNGDCELDYNNNCPLDCEYYEGGDMYV